VSLAGGVSSREIFLAGNYFLSGGVSCWEGFRRNVCCSAIHLGIMRNNSRHKKTAMNSMPPQGNDETPGPEPDEDDDEAPETPPDEPEPTPIEEPPPEPGANGPYVVAG
jgi:hypothetical protein